MEPHALSMCLAGAVPRVVVILRHGEKPKDLTDEGLSEKGERRAKALATLLPKVFGKPDALYAMVAGATHRRTLRPAETLEPLGDATGVSVDTSFGFHDAEHLAATVLSAHAGGVVVICWVHDGLLDLAKRLGVKKPPSWPGGAYDSYWVLSDLERHAQGETRLEVRRQGVHVE